ncbi:hypothetical protein [[Clostridium] polysaccharolyticum]|uniref:Uncharacterized protein n=1 Tax=[Clostridium] polysaccharolyticum TaxID=29364 RepID=A0A1H9YH28_9FIRM|nr:hypothetical protein [[Clostridium] polysaccharolyticum]SES68273.1 hypothetical protein SAMN04487772_10213 [[Clostridium] polysaccharolyticum]
MKETLSKVMKRAWEIKRQDVRNIFSLCLKMAWAEVKKGGNTIEKLTEDIIENINKGVAKTIEMRNRRFHKNEEAKFFLTSENTTVYNDMTVITVNMFVNYKTYKQLCRVYKVTVKENTYNVSTKKIFLETVSVENTARNLLSDITAALAID